MDMRDDEEETDGEHEEVEMLGEGVTNDSMLKHFFILDVELFPTCSSTPNSLNLSPVISMPRRPLHVLELWPLLPQLEHFLVIGGANEEGNGKERCAFVIQRGLLIRR